MIALIWSVNLLGWPLIHFAIGFMGLRLPAYLFERDSWITAPRRWEQDGDFYRNWLAIRKWKSHLPDGAPWHGGFAKKRIYARDPAHLTAFLIETRRANGRTGVCSAAFHFSSYGTRLGCAWL